MNNVPIDFIQSDLLPYYFRGLIDGDGCIHNNGKISIYSGTKSFIENIQNIYNRHFKLEIVAIMMISLSSRNKMPKNNI